MDLAPLLLEVRKRSIKIIARNGLALLADRPNQKIARRNDAERTRWHGQRIVASETEIASGDIMKLPNSKVTAMPMKSDPKARKNRKTPRC